MQGPFDPAEVPAYVADLNKMVAVGTFGPLMASAKISGPFYARPTAERAFGPRGEILGTGGRPVPHAARCRCLECT